MKLIYHLKHMSVLGGPRGWLSDIVIMLLYLQITPCLPFLRKRSPDGATPN